jgi:hypothetical protein
MVHRVAFSIPERDLGVADVKFNVMQDGAKFGTLEVSRGSVVWYPRDKKVGHRLTWIQVDQEAQKYRKVERR